MTILPPGVTHDGRPAPGAGGFRKRELYLDDGFLPVALSRLNDGLLTGRDGGVLDRSVPHLVRRLGRRYGLSPYAYVVGRRIDTARRLLLQGALPADAATAVGFYDQAHFTRHFKKHTSTTPARYARSHARQS